MEIENKNRRIPKFPWKLVVHVLLALTTSIQVIEILNETTGYSRSYERIIYNLFLENSNKGDIDFKRTVYLYTVQDIKNKISDSINNFENLKNNSLDNFEYVPNYNVNMHVLYIDNNFIQTNDINSIPNNFLFNINSTDLGPFSYPDSQIKTYLNDVLEFRIFYKFKSYIPKFYPDNFQCFIWNLHQKYDFINRGHFVLTLKIDMNECDDINGQSVTIFNSFMNKLQWIHVIVIILALISFISTWNYISKIAKLYGKIRENFIKKNKNHSEADLSNSDDSIYYNPLLDSSKHKETIEKKNTEKNRLNEEQFKLFDGWSVICIIGNIIQIFGSILYLFENTNKYFVIEILLGFGCMIAHLNIGRYLNVNPEYSAITDTLKRSFPNILRYLLGVMPIFVGFIFLGICLFWKSERFATISGTMMSLFALINGDSMFGTFNDLSNISLFIGQLYTYMFCILFIVVVTNVFIAILEEAYIEIKMRTRIHWIYAYLKIDNDNKQLEWKEEKYKRREVEKPKYTLKSENVFNKNSIQKLNSLGKSQNKFSLFKENVLNQSPEKNRKEYEVERELSPSKNVNLGELDPKKKIENLIKETEFNFDDMMKICVELSKTKDFEEKSEILEAINIMEKKITSIKNNLIMDED